MERAEVIVVGSGPAGAAVAKRLVDAGVDVLMLECGTPPEDDRFAVMEEAVLGVIPWKAEPYPYEMLGDDVELDDFAIRRLGGSSLAWGAITPRYQPSDFELHRRYGVGVDWPLRYEELEPFFCDAEDFMGVAGAVDNPWAPPRSRPYPMGAFPMNDTDLLVKEGAAKLGIKFHSVPVARNSVKYDGRSACAYYGTCRACPIGAMYSSDQTVARLLQRPNFRLRTEAEVSRVELTASGALKGVVYLDAEGKEHAALAPRVVLAVQSVETARILLHSSSPRFPDGLANGSGTVGKYFIEHPKFYVIGRVKQQLHPFLQGFETATTYQFHDHEKRGERAAGRLLVREDAGLSPGLIAAGSGNWGERLRAEIRENFGRTIKLGAFLEQLPHEENRIVLSKSVKRRDGGAAARVEFTLVREYERAGFHAMKATMEQVLESVGATDVRVLMDLSNSGHYMGGHRMGSDPATSVCDANLECHEVKGLYLAGGGVFPTSGIANPTLTTVALSLRSAAAMLAGR